MNWTRIYHNKKGYDLCISDYDIKLALNNVGKLTQISGTLFIIAEDLSTIKLFNEQNNRMYINSIWKNK